MFNNTNEWKDRINRRESEYITFRKRLSPKKILKYALIFGVIITLIITLWLWPSWYGNINLKTQLYINKADANYLTIYFLNFWSSNFFFNKTCLISALIGFVLMVLPPDRTVLTYINSRLGRGSVSRLKAFIFWGVIGFVLFYLIGFVINAGDSFAWTVYLIENGEVGISNIFAAFNVIFNINSTDYIAVFIYSNLVFPIISLILGIIIFRILLYLIRNVYLVRNDFNIISCILSIIGIACLIGFFSLPLSPLNGINLIQIWSLLFGCIGFLTLALLIGLYSRSKVSKTTREVIIPSTLRKRVIIVITAVVVFVISPLIISLGPIINLNNTAVWTEQEWQRKIERQIEWSRECAGLDMFEERPIENFTESSTSPDALMVSQIRQFDQDFAVQYLAASIGSTFEALADSDIVYINNKEYWVAPKTVRFSEIAGDAVQTNTELYDHVEGFLAMDTFSGNLVNVSTTFNIAENYPIFFGESESRRFLELSLGYYEEGALIGAYDSDILLGTEWAEGIPNNEFRYEGTPDGTLIGLEGFWKTINIGLLAYALEGSHDYLINRNVKTRVSDVLLPQLQIDGDPYLIFNIGEGKLYYAVSIYTQINIGSYSNVPILRFLGVCLVDVLNGEMDFYENPSLNVNDPTYPLWKIYMDSYDWNPTPSWLEIQLRYPEDLFEKQLEANYIYHVQNPSSWRRADDFHERPTDGDLFYIETDVGNGIEYVGLDLVEYKGQSATLLAGVYIVRHGDHFGEGIFYYTRGSTQNLVGPNTARQTYSSEATQEISLISGARNGNTLIYPLAGSLYYYIPTYSTAGQLQQLKLAGFVEAFTRTVGYGENAQDAYNALNITGIVPTTNLTIFYKFDMEPTINYPSDPANFKIQLQNLDNNFSAPGVNVKVNLTLYSSATNNLNYTLILPPSLLPIANSTFIDGSDAGYNFTIIDKDFYFGEGLTINGFLNTNKSDVILYYKWTLIVDGEVVYQSLDGLISVF